LESAPQTEVSDAEAAKEELALEEERLNKKDTELSQRKSELDEKEEALNTKDQELKQRETAVAEGESRINKLKQEYLVSAAKIYEGMEAKKAASAIAGLKTKEEMVLIFLNM
jgi:flagellar motility protein MotE (MotC chaperone)